MNIIYIYGIIHQYIMYPRNHELRGVGFDNSVASPGFDYTNQIWAYNVTSDTWRNASAAGAPTERSEASMVASGGTLLIYGGDGPSYSGETLMGRGRGFEDVMSICSV